MCYDVFLKNKQKPQRGGWEVGRMESQASEAYRESQGFCLSSLHHYWGQFEAHLPWLLSALGSPLLIHSPFWKLFQVPS